MDFLQIETEKFATIPNMTTHCLTIDIEDWYHSLPRSQWEELTPRVETTTYKILNQLRTHKIKATFFVLGYIADRHPKMVETITEDGHEIGIHGFDHQAANRKSPTELASDISAAIASVERVTGERPFLYRAPAFSVDLNSEEMWRVIAEQGITHDSSLYKSLTHQEEKIPRQPFQFGLRSGQVITEYPLYTTRYLGFNMPFNGGGYFRMLPLKLTCACFHRQSQSSIFYIHPRDLDPGLPQIPSIGRLGNFKVRIGLKSAQNKFSQLLETVPFAPLLATYGMGTFPEVDLFSIRG
ncbi:MAG TPA: DUF3473 domain-containing protein [Gammaproteobacteria bacterium]|nr:DUF3473 domain-containing protein [Gammaproteobacteria bacterium]